MGFSLEGFRTMSLARLDAEGAGDFVEGIEEIEWMDPGALVPCLPS
jgi:hypothetical protein